MSKHDHGFITSITPNDDAPSQGLTWILYHANGNVVYSNFSLSLFFGFIICATTSSHAEELVDDRFAFRVNIPAPFIEIETEQLTPETLYVFMDREPTADDPALVIQIQRLRGQINVDDRLAIGDIPKIDGMVTTLEEMAWQGITLDVMRQTTNPDSIPYVVYTVQYPLAVEAVQLQIGGPLTLDAQVRSVFETTSASFRNTEPLHQTETQGRLPLTNPERTNRIVWGVVRLSLTAIVLLSIGGFILRAVRAG